MAQGGKREGAGRPKTPASIKEANTIIGAKLRGGAELGWEVLAEEYPSLMRAAIAEALGHNTPTGRGNASMLKALLELLPKIVGTDTSEETPTIMKILAEFYVKPNADNGSRPAVEEHRRDDNKETNSRNGHGNETNLYLHRMDGSP